MLVAGFLILDGLPKSTTSQLPSERRATSPFPLSPRGEGILSAILGVAEGQGNSES